MKDKFNLIVFLLGFLMVIWLALLVAPFINSGIIEIVRNLQNKMNNPFNIEFCEDTIKTIIIFSVIYFIGIGIYLSNKSNYRRGEEYGSAMWGNSKTINKKYMQKPESQNKILTQNVKIGLNAKKHRRNLNTLVCGGSRCWKNKILCET